MTFAGFHPGLLSYVRAGAQAGVTYSTRLTTVSTAR
jgi:hypothetical protein